jgi:iturin family lipopeptide synthetase A/iturin family lipopeptide synthetase C/tyrocidine synthetase-3
VEIRSGRPSKSKENENGNRSVVTSATHISEWEHQSLVINFNDSAAPYPSDKTVVELFEAQVARTPDDEAVRLGDQSLSYGQLNERANLVSAHLRRLGARPERLVTLYMEHSIEVICATLGVLKAGAAYVPVDPVTTPKERLAFILKDISDGTAAGGASPILVTHSWLLKGLPRDEAEVVTLDSDFAQFEKYPASNPQTVASPRNLAYVIYTSGSTGKPKGVLIEHGSLLNYIWWANLKYCQGGQFTWPLFSSLAFDLTVTSIFTPLISGGRIVIYPEDPGLHGMAVLKVIEDREVDIVKLTPSHLTMIKDMDLGATRIRKLIVGGENFKTELARDITEKFGRPVEIYNEYGPTEATVGCMIHRYNEEIDGGLSVPIGIPAANTGVYILDEHLGPVPTGETGEMYLAGVGLARGYLNRSEFTEQKFLTAEDPRENGPAERSPVHNLHPLRLYKTGDVARWSANGRVEFLGRTDNQVKIGGIRIELGEIETRLQAHPRVQDCVVDVIHSGLLKASREQFGLTEPPPTEEAGTDRLVAYYVSEKALTATEVRAHLAKELPGYMLPQYVMWLEKLPLTPNGKIDRKALPIPTYLDMQPAHEFVSPRTEIEIALARIWTDLLKVDTIGINDDFFDLGGHSLLAIRLLARIEEAFGRGLPLAALLQAPTVKRLAALLSAEEPDQRLAYAIPIQPEGEEPPFFCVGAGPLLRPLCDALGNSRPFYSVGLEPTAVGQFSRPFRAEEVAKHLVAAVRKAQPNGPYYLGGFCTDGVLAYEAARQLALEGCEVGRLILFETANPNPLRKTRLATGLKRLATRLRYRVKQISRVKPGELTGYVRDRSRELKLSFQRTMWRWSGIATSHNSQAVAPDMEQLLYTAAISYKPQPITCPTSLFQANDGPIASAGDPYFGWREMLQGPCETYEVPGDHAGIFAEANVNVMARLIKASLLRKSESQARESSVPHRIGWTAVGA